MSVILHWDIITLKTFQKVEDRGTTVSKIQQLYDNTWDKISFELILKYFHSKNVCMQLI